VQTVTIQVEPIIDSWYLHLDKGQRFFVVAVDKEEGLIETQHIDGDLEEINFATWFTLDIEPSVPPENWAGALDIDEQDDFGTEITDTSPEDFTDELEDIQRPEI
jgi:hypothetical protein